VDDPKRQSYFTDIEFGQDNIGISNYLFIIYALFDISYLLFELFLGLIAPFSLGYDLVCIFAGVMHHLCKETIALDQLIR